MVWTIIQYNMVCNAYIVDYYKHIVNCNTHTGLQ